MWASALLAQGLPPPKWRVAARLLPSLLFSCSLKVLPGSCPRPLSPAWHVVGLSAGSATVICRRLDIPGCYQGGLPASRLRYRWPLLQAVLDMCGLSGEVGDDGDGECGGVGVRRFLALG